VATALAGVTFKVACAWHAIVACVWHVICGLHLASYLWLAFGELFVACIWQVICGLQLASYLWLLVVTCGQCFSMQEHSSLVYRC